MKKCTRCNEINPDQANFCMKCGTNLSNSVEDDPENQSQKPLLGKWEFMTSRGFGFSSQLLNRSLPTILELKKGGTFSTWFPGDEKEQNGFYSLLETDEIRFSNEAGSVLSKSTLRYTVENLQLIFIEKNSQKKIIYRR